MQQSLYGERHRLHLEQAASTSITATVYEQIPFKNLETPEKSVQIANGYPSNLAALSLFLSCCWSFFTPAFFLPSLMSFWSFCLARSGDVSQKLCWPLSFLSLLFCPSEELEVNTFRITPSWIAYPARFPCLVNILPYLKWSWTSCEINIEIKSTLGWKKKNQYRPRESGEIRGSSDNKQLAFRSTISQRSTTWHYIFAA